MMPGTSRRLLSMVTSVMVSAAMALALMASDARPTAGGQVNEQQTFSRWSEDSAWDWYRSQPWPCGFNYISANAISYTEMWMDYAFDPDLIDSELALAEQIGFNCLRVVLPYVVWEAEPDAFKQRLDQFLELCDRRGIRVMFTLFDDCVFGPITDPVFGPQPDVVEGWYANGWTPSPGHAMVRDESAHPKLERYVKDIISTFKDDPRVWVWDLYNEPMNAGLGEASIPLLKKVFAWAREVNPAQPLTVGEWNGQVYRHVGDQVDIVSFHNYHPGDRLAAEIAELKKLGRPILCTEWLNRGLGSTVEQCLPVLLGEDVGAMHWGLVNGRTQTHLNWGHKPGDPEPTRWQHDLLRPDHTEYDPAEIAAFRRAIINARR
jgi:hypothetical protein